MVRFAPMSSLDRAASQLRRLGAAMRDDSARRLTRGEMIGLFVLVAIPTIMNAIALSSEFTIPVASLNDNELHFLFLQRASDALASGENVFDFWVPSIEAGFPQFLYYQHLPTLVMLAVERLSFGNLDLLTSFNLVRYLLLVGLPLSVFISMRWFGFSVVAAALAAAASTLLSGDFRYGFDYDSYIWRGFGMTTQLFAMHLSFLTLAAAYRAFQKGKGVWIAALLFGILVLTHLIYAYMTAMAILVIAVWGLNRTNLKERFGRGVVVGGFAAVISSYVWWPLLTGIAYMNATPYLQQAKYDSYGAGPILGWLVTGDLVDHGRLPVLTVLFFLGVVAAVLMRSRAALVVLGVFLVWLVAYFGRPTLGPITDLFPLHDGLLFHRFIGPVTLAAILLMGLGGAVIWFLFRPDRSRPRLVAAVIVMALLLAPAIIERQTFYRLNTAWQQRSISAVDGDADAQAVLARLRTLPPGRVFMGLPATYGNSPGMTFEDLHFYNLLAFEAIEGLARPIESLSLNADYIWEFNDRDPWAFDAFNVRFMVAPSDYATAPFLVPILRTNRYTLYEAPTTGYAEFVRIEARVAAPDQAALFTSNIAWARRPPTGAARTYIRYDYPATVPGIGPSTMPGCDSGAQIPYATFHAGKIDLVVECPTAADPHPQDDVPPELAGDGGRVSRCRRSWFRRHTSG